MFEKTILSHLVYNEKYTRKVIAFLKDDYFHSQDQKTVFEIIQQYFQKFNSVPTKEVIKIELDGKTLNQTLFSQCITVVDDLNVEDTELDWLVTRTEKFCQDKAIYNAIMESISIIDGNGKQDKGALPKILQDALGVSFDSHIGHDFIADANDRYEFYHHKEEKIPFNLEFMNKITQGGLARKTLNVIMASTGGGKSLFMCHCAATNMMDGKNVLYITLEMSEQRIAERIDANLMNVPISDLSLLPKDTYVEKLAKIKSKTTGKLIVKEYPTAAGNANHFRHLLNELKIKKNFVADVIYIDYINICASSRVRMGGSINTYQIVKSIAEELRGLATEFDVPIITATQVNRGGMGSSDIELTDTSESVGLPQTADLMFALISTEELEQLGQVMVKQLKNRYNDPSVFRRFVLGIDRARMRLYDVEQGQQEIVEDDKPTFDKSDFGVAMTAEKKERVKKLLV